MCLDKTVLLESNFVSYFSPELCLDGLTFFFVMSDQTCVYFIIKLEYLRWTNNVFWYHKVDARFSFKLINSLSWFNQFTIKRYIIWMHSYVKQKTLLLKIVLKSWRRQTNMERGFNFLYVLILVICLGNPKNNSSPNAQYGQQLKVLLAVFGGCSDNVTQTWSFCFNFTNVTYILSCKLF